MAKFLLLTFDGSGNQVPMIGVAQALREHGHEVTFAGYLNQRERFVAQGFSFLLLERAAAAFQLNPAYISHVLASTDHFYDVLDAFERTSCDLLVIDCVMQGALAACEKHHLPTAILVHSAPGLLVPPNGQFEQLILARVNTIREAAGLDAGVSIWDIWSRFPTLCASLAELDPLAYQAPASFTYIGPIFEQFPKGNWNSPWPSEDARPLVLVSFSGFAGFDQVSRIERTLAALANQHYRILVTANMTNIAGLAVPENAIVIPFVPHVQVLPHTTIVVTHAGHGTVTAALAHGVPLVCMPNVDGFDQSPLAAKVMQLGAGINLDGDASTPYEIKQAINTVVHERSYGSAAQRLGETISRARSSVSAVAWLAHVVERPVSPEL